MKYKEDYQVGRILDGKADKKIKTRAMKARFDERLSLVGLLLDSINEEIRGVIEGEDLLQSCMECVKKFRGKSTADKKNPKVKMDKVISQEEKSLEADGNSGALSQNERIRRQKTILFLRELSAKIAGEEDGESAFKTVKKEYNAKVKELSEEADVVKKRLSNMFLFSEEIFGEGQELLIMVTHLTVNYNSARFISEFGCEEYFRHNKELLFYERQKSIITKMEKLGL